MIRDRFYFGVMALTFLGFPVAAAEKPQPRAELLSFEELTAQLQDPTLRILDARPRAAYDAGHIPGAVWVNTAAAEKLAASPEGLTNQKAWSEWLAPLGISNESHVLVYDANRQLAAARVWWLLTYLGVEHVALLNGGFALWQTEDRAVDTNLPAPGPSQHVVKLQANRLADREDVLTALEKQEQKIVDARSDAEFSGSELRSKRGGHLPQACHLEWLTLVDADGRFLPTDQLRQRVKELGIMPGDAVIAHCQGGGRASVNAFALERLGFQTRNYYLGWSEWGNLNDTPIEKADKPEQP